MFFMCVCYLLIGYVNSAIFVIPVLQGLLARMRSVFMFHLLINSSNSNNTDIYTQRKLETR